MKAQVITSMRNGKKVMTISYEVVETICLSLDIDEEDGDDSPQYAYEIKHTMAPSQKEKWNAIIDALKEQENYNENED